MNKADIVRKLIDDNPKMAAREMARYLHDKHPETFHSIENARSTVRRTVGSNGDYHRHRVTSTHFTPENLKKMFKFEDGERFDISPWTLPKNVRKIAILADLQIPYHDKGAVMNGLEFAYKKDVDAIILNGDIMDCYQLSRFVKDPKARDMAYELDVTRQFLRELREAFPKTLIYLKEGNHEERWQTWIRQYGYQFCGLTEFRLDVVLKLREMQIEWVNRKKLIRFGKLNILHGHEYKGGSGGVNPARWLYLRTYANTVCGHFHQVSQHIDRDVTGKSIGCWSMGCLCDLNPEYMPYNKWTHGFGYGELMDDSGGFRFSNKEIIDYKVI